MRQKCVNVVDNRQWIWLVAAVWLTRASTVFAAEETAATTHHGWLSILPPVLAIGLALWKRQVIVALIFGLYAGVVILEGNLLTAFLRLGDQYLVGALADDSHAAILMFSTILGGMVGVLSRSGATGGIVHWLGKKVWDSILRFGHCPSISFTPTQILCLSAPSKTPFSSLHATSHALQFIQFL